MKNILYLILFIPSLLQAQNTYYIDQGGDDNNGNGSLGNEWASLSYACTKVTTPGDTIFVTAGRYIEPNKCELAVGVSIKGEGTASHIICNYVAGANSYRDASITLFSPVEGTNGNQSISYIKLDGNNLTATKGISVVARNNVKIHHCTIVDFENGGIYLGGNLGAFHTSPTIYSTRNEIYSNIINNCSTYQPTHGVSGMGNMGCIDISGQSEMLIHDNIISDTSRISHNGDIIDGVEGSNKNSKIYNNMSYKDNDNGYQWSMHYEIWDCEGGIEVYNNEFYGGYVAFDLGGYYAIKGDSAYSWYIHNNLFYQSTLQSHAYGNQVAMCLEGNAEDIIVAYNHIINYGNGVDISVPSYVTGNKTSQRHKVYYNIFENIGYTNTNYGGAITLSQGIDDGTIDNIDIYNNVMVSNTGSYRSYAGVWLIIQSDFSNINIKNNIIQDFGYAPVIFDQQPSGGTLDKIDIEYNLHYNNGNNDSILIWHDLVPTNYTYANNIVGNPDFVLPINFHLQKGSPAFKTGIDVGLDADYEGAPVNSPPNIGAFEGVWSISGQVWPATIVADNCNYDATKPMGVGVYDLYSNKTVVTFLGLNGNPYVAVCDHSNNNTWSDPIKVGDHPTGDKYGYPQIVQTNDGIFHIFYAKNNTNLFHGYSTKPNNPYDWDNEELIINSERYASLKPAYPTAFVARSGILYVMWNQYFGDVSRPIFYSKSLDNGKSFQAGMPAIYTNNSNYLNEIFLGQITKEPDLPNKPEQFHFVFISAGGPTHNTYHKDIYHTIFRPENDHFYGMNGTDLGTSIDETELVANCIVLNTGTPLDSIYPSENNTVVVGDNQIPVINGKYRWDGSKFVAYTPNGLIPDSIDSYQWQNGKMFAFGGINPISVYESSDYGLNWTKIADMILPRRNPGGDQKTVPITYPSHPIARLWSKEVIPDLSENIVTVGGPGAKGIPDQIILKSRPVYVKSGDTCTISAFICDAENALVITADNPVVFNLTGQGALLGSGYVTASQGKALISYKAGSGSGSSIITATSPQLKSTYIEILFDEGGQPSDTTSPPDTTGNTQPPPDFELAISGVPNVFTPNGDGINETWIIPSIDNFPDAVIRIYDRNLKQIIQYNGLDPDWDGNDSNGNPMPAGAYLYLIDLNNGMRPTKGYISLIK